MSGELSSETMISSQVKITLMSSLAIFILEDTLSVEKDNASSPFLYLRRIIHLDELGQTFIGRLFMRSQYKDEHKTLEPRL